MCVRQPDYRRPHGLWLISLAASIILQPMAAFAQSDSNTPPASIETLELQLYRKKFKDLPFEDRLIRLERQLGTPAPQKGVSTPYRINQLNQARLAHASDQAKRSAIQLYNQAIDKAEQGQSDEAIALYKKSLEQNPAFLEASNNLATLLENQQRYDQAIEVYQQALRHFPKEPLLYRNLGVVYERTGKIQEALKQYKSYLQLNPSPDPPIQAIVENYNANRNLAESTEDYLPVTRSATRGRQLTWPAYAMPIPVFIEVGHPMHARLLPQVREGMRQWEDASRGQLRFKEVSVPPVVGIYLSFKPAPISDPIKNVGHASFKLQEHENAIPGREEMQVQITINTGTPSDGLSLEHRREQVGRLILHELGHAIGIWGHSPNPGDIMFTRPIVSELSNRDLSTIQKLYGVKK